MTFTAPPLNHTTREVALADPATTDRLGKLLATVVGTRDVVALWGDLGAGKTSLARALIQALLAVHGQQEDVPSPTFTLVQTYEAGGLPIWHADLYRLSHPDELLELGLEEALESGLLLIEWPDRMEGDLPGERLDISLEEVGEGRLARLTGWGVSWEERVNRISVNMADKDA